MWANTFHYSIKTNNNIQIWLIVRNTAEWHIVQLTHYKYNNNTFMKNLKITKMHRYGNKK